MAKFFDTFNVIEEDGTWTQGYPATNLGAGFKLITQDICEPVMPAEPDDFEMGADVKPFVITAFEKVPPRCAPKDVGDFVDAAIEASSEWAVSHALWHGPDGVDVGEMYLTHPNIDTVTRGPDPFTTIGSLLEAAYAKAPYMQPVIHLGVQTALALQYGLATLGVPYVVPKGYPPDAIAVTGPITIRLGSVQNLSSVDTSINRQYFEATRIAAIEFDPAQAVRSS